MENTPQEIDQATFGTLLGINILSLVIGTFSAVFLYFGSLLIEAGAGETAESLGLMIGAIVLVLSIIMIAIYSHIYKSKKIAKYGLKLALLAIPLFFVFAPMLSIVTFFIEAIF